MLLLLDNHDSFTWNLAELLRSSGIPEFRIISSSDFDISGMRDYDRIIFSPGPGLPDEQPAMSTILKELELLHGKGEPVPQVLGVCLGMQAIGVHFGGKLINLPSVVHGQPRNLQILCPNHPLFHGIPDNSQVGLYHSWAVDPQTLPGCLQLLATSHEGTIMALAHRSLPVTGVQFHPESILTPLGGRMLRNWFPSS